MVLMTSMLHRGEQAEVEAELREVEVEAREVEAELREVEVVAKIVEEAIVAVGLQARVLMISSRNQAKFSVFLVWVLIPERRIWEMNLPNLEKLLKLILSLTKGLDVLGVSDSFTLPIWRMRWKPAIPVMECVWMDVIFALISLWQNVLIHLPLDVIWAVSIGTVAVIVAMIVIVHEEDLLTEIAMILMMIAIMEDRRATMIAMDLRMATVAIADPIVIIINLA
jgi:hypothetical protein